MMTEIAKSTDEQRKKAIEYQEKYWEQATSTEPADRERAERATKRIAEMIGVNARRTIWVTSPEDGNNVFEAEWASISTALGKSLRGMFIDSFRNYRKDFLWGYFNRLFDDTDEYALKPMTMISLRDALNSRLAGPYSKEIWDRYSYSPINLVSSLILDAGWLAQYSYGVNVLGISGNMITLKLLSIYNELAASCFALWIVPGVTILCDRPEKVKIENNRLVGITYRK